MPYMVTFTINIPQMLAYIPAPWILWDIDHIDHIDQRKPNDRESLRPFSNVFWNAKNGLRIPSFFGQQKWASHNNRVNNGKDMDAHGGCPSHG